MLHLQEKAKVICIIGDEAKEAFENGVLYIEKLASASEVNLFLQRRKFRKCSIISC